ncbi:MAG: hypothetical protein ACK559_09810, partial [bacterium]
YLFLTRGSLFIFIYRIIFYNDKNIAFCIKVPDWLGTTGMFSPTELTSYDDMERGLGEWRRINVSNECD